jgi:protein phosphatase
MDPLADTVVDQPAQPPGGLTGQRRIATVRIELGALTDQGKVRTNNEDNFHVASFGRYLRTLLSSLPEGQVPDHVGEVGYAYAVADGMGGKAAGEIASRLAISLLIQHVLETPDWIFANDESSTSEVIDRTVQRFRNVNEGVIQSSETRPALKGMGTTLSLAMSLGDQLIVAHVGDSRVYLSRAGTLHRLTSDHTMAQRLARMGVRDAARFHHILTHAIGIAKTGGEPDISRYRLLDGDRLLLCTDGLTEMVDEAALARELARDAPAEEVCRTLIDLALAAGGKDNVTVVVAGYRMP